MWAVLTGEQVCSWSSGKARLQNDLFYIRWDVKLSSVALYGNCVCLFTDFLRSSKILTVQNCVICQSVAEFRYQLTTVFWSSADLLTVTVSKSIIIIMLCPMHRFLSALQSDETVMWAPCVQIGRSVLVGEITAHFCSFSNCNSFVDGYLPSILKWHRKLENILKKPLRT